MSSTIQSRAARASTAGLVSTATTIALQILTVPIVLTFWGVERYGVWLAVIAGFMVARTIDGGYIAYVGNQLNVLYHQDNEGLRRTLGSSLAICTGLGILQLMLCGGVLAAGVAPNLLGVAAESRDANEVGPALVILILAWLLAGSFPSVVHRLLVPTGLLANSIWWGLGYQVAQFAVIAVAAYAGATVLQAAAAYAAVQAIMYLVSAGYVRRKLPGFYPWWRGGTMAAGLGDLYRSMALTAGAGAQQAWLNGTVLAVSGVLGAAMVPVFTTLRTLANLWTNLANVLVGALSPEVVRYYGTNQHEKLALAFRASTLLSGVAINLSLLAVLPFVETIYTTWTRETVAFDPHLFLYLVAGVSVWNAGLAYSTFLTAINSLKAQLMLTLARACIALGVGVSLIGTLGLFGLGIGILLGEIAASLLAAFVYAPRMIAARGDHPLQQGQLEGFLISLPVVVVSLFGAWYGKLPAALIAGGVMCVSYLAWRTWLRLPREARIRAISLFRPRVSSGS